MTYEQMKFTMGDYLRCRRIHERHKRELELLQSKLVSVGISIDYSKPKVKSSGSGNAAYADWITEAMFLADEIRREADEVASARIQVEKRIAQLKDPEKEDVLRYKYINAWTWREIGQVAGYTDHRARHLCYEAIRELADKS